MIIIRSAKVKNLCSYVKINYQLLQAIIEEELNLSPTKTFDPNRKTELLDALIKEELKLNPIKDDYLEALIQEELNPDVNVNMKQNDTKNSNGQVSELEENTKMELSLCMEDNPEAPTIQVSSEIFEVRILITYCILICCGLLIIIIRL